MPREYYTISHAQNLQDLIIELDKILADVSYRLGQIYNENDNLVVKGRVMQANPGIQSDEGVIVSQLEGLLGGASGGSGATSWTRDYVKVSDVKAYNVDGGAFNNGAWRTRAINTEDSDARGICTINSNQITLDAGTYECSILCPAFAVDRHAARLYNVSDGAETLLGTVNFSAVTATLSIIKGRFTLTAQKTFEVQHRCSKSKATDGFGTKTDISGVNSVYTVAEFWRVAF